MLPKQQRLTAAEVRLVLKSGTPSRLGALSAKVLPAPKAKAAVVISSKVARKAVVRNRLRRAAYAALRPHLPARKHVVFFLHKPQVDPTDITALCSKLS